MPTPVSATRSSAPSSVGSSVDLDPAAGGRELDRVADEVAQHLAEALRVVAAGGPARRAAFIASVDALALGARLRPAGWRSRRRRAGRPAADRAATRPDSSLDSSSRLVASQSSRSICWRLCSRNSSRVAVVHRRSSASSSLKVRSAAIGVRSSCDTSARKSRLRSRSRADELDRLLEPLGHRVERLGQLGHLGRAAAAASTRVSRWPSASSRAAPVRRRIGLVSHSAMKTDAMTATISAMTAATTRTPTIVSSVWAR